jgi:hypothetical protein
VIAEANNDNVLHIVNKNKTPPKLNVDNNIMVSTQCDRRTSKIIATLKKTADSTSLLEIKKKLNFQKEIVRRKKT